MRNRSVPVLLGLAGLSWAVAQALLPDMGLAWSDRLAAVAEAPARQEVATALLVAAGCLLVGSAIAVARVPRSGRGARLTLVGTVLLGLGGVWLAAGRGAFSLMMARMTAPEVPREAALSVAEAESGLGFLPLLLCLPALLLGPVLLGIAVRRNGTAGWLPLACWVAGIATFVASEFTFKLGETIGIAVAATGLLLLGRALSLPTTAGSEGVLPATGAVEATVKGTA